jgi:hypothetical protein
VVVVGLAAAATLVVVSRCGRVRPSSASVGKQAAPRVLSRTPSHRVRERKRTPTRMPLDMRRAYSRSQLSPNQTKTQALGYTQMRPLDQSPRRRMNERFTASQAPASVDGCGVGRSFSSRPYSPLQSGARFSWLQIHVPFFLPRSVDSPSAAFWLPAVVAILNPKTNIRPGINTRSSTLSNNTRNSSIPSSNTRNSSIPSSNTRNNSTRIKRKFRLLLRRLRFQGYHPLLLRAVQLKHSTLRWRLLLS